MKETILSYSIDELKEILVTQNQPKFRAEQIFYELHAGKTLDQISTIPKDLITQLQSDYDDAPVRIETVKKSTDGTEKFLFALSDGNIIEGVLMSYKFGHTLCVSTQVGCRMGCKFCASGLDGLVRNLTAGEILGQIVVANRHLGGDVKTRKITNIVLMGSGEPLDNYDNVLKFLDIITDKHGLYFSSRNISLSTCGLVDKIKSLADSGHQIHLCLSLHAPNDDTRLKLMPIARAHKISDILDACRYYSDKTNRRILFEYIMIDGVNSNREQALTLAKKISNINCIVNLINLNPVPESDLKSCSKETIDAFATVLKTYNISVTTRRALGTDIDGACGQLRRKYIKGSK